MRVIDIKGMVKIPNGFDISEENFEYNRNFIRKLLIEMFLTEKSGSKKISSKYKYIVENTDIGNIYLIRPAQRRWGFDFVVHIENYTFLNSKKGSNPSHDDILLEIENKLKELDNDLKEIFCEALYKIYLCADPDEIINEYKFLNSTNNEGKLSIEAILKLLKWLFIEQDIRYWNYSGRNMLFGGIKNLFNKYNNQNNST